MPQRKILLTPRATSWSGVVPIIALLAGALFATSATASKGAELRSAATGVPDLIRQQDRSNDRLTGQVNKLQREVDELTRHAESGNVSVRRLKERADAVAPMAGRTEAVGPAVRVSLTDSQLRGDQLPDGFTVDDIVVHQQDVQAVVNALWAGGATAMTIQDQRVISTSAVRCVGNTLILQGRVYSPPYVITAIGKREALAESLRQSPEVLIYQEYVDAVGLGYDVTELEEVTMPPYEGSIAPKYARVMP